jgi:hypothetical protein
VRYHERLAVAVARCDAGEESADGFTDERNVVRPVVIAQALMHVVSMSLLSVLLPKHFSRRAVAGVQSGPGWGILWKLKFRATNFAP